MHSLIAADRATGRQTEPPRVRHDRPFGEIHTEVQLTYYRTDVPDTASELFDGELVIAHYGSGHYYSLSQSGALVWQGLRHGLSSAEVASWLAGHFTADALTMPEQVAAIIAGLESDGLLAAVEQRAKSGEHPVIALEKWNEPVLERFDDLQELLLLDPVHDVSEAGWPHRPDDAA